jgi:hypothetical protein
MLWLPYGIREVFSFVANEVQSSGIAQAISIDMVRCADHFHSGSYLAPE